MRDYQFGEFLTSLRLSNGYSQFQLGKLLGVSDKAVSKWETGAAKPRTSICGKLASVYGITLDELMDCRQETGSARMQGEQSVVEDHLWQTVHLRLKKIYGDRPPVTFTSRLDAEEVLMRGTGMIEHLRLKAMLWKRGIRCSDWFVQDTSLTAWLLGAAFINPLQPHTVCPHCKKTVLHPEVKDGWDLPEAFCACGHSLIRDGHNVPLALEEKRFMEMDRRVCIGIAPDDETVLRELIREQYQSRWELNEYALAKGTEGEPTLASVFDIKLRFFFLAPAGTKLPFPVVNGVYQLPSDDYILRVAEIPETLMYVIEDPFSFESFTNKKLPVLPELKDLLRPELLQQARERIRLVPAITIGDFAGLRMPVKLNPSDQEDPADSGFGDVSVYDEEDIADDLPDPLSFSTLLRCTPPSGFRQLWHTFIREVVHDGKVAVSDFPMSLEDLFDQMKQQLLHVGIQDSGIALKAFASMREEGPSPEIAEALLAIGCDPWLPAYIRHVVKNGQLRSKTYLIAAAYCYLCRLALLPEADAADDEGNPSGNSMTYDAIIQAAMMKHAAIADISNEGASNDA